MAEDRDMHRYHYPVKNLVDEIFGLILPKFRVVDMDRLSIRWSPAPAHQWEGCHEANSVHDVGRHKE
jgi:hypothetical protein